MKETHSKIEITIDSHIEVTVGLLESLCRSYDWYPEMIDDNKQMNNAFTKNEIILNNLKEIGVTKAVIRGFMSVSGTVHDKFLIGEDNENI
jgi:hypothetical protein